ncbi:hypothetical protein JD844_001782 [Phrynosoma platyrhinos]|uniref:Uncharacterized protein n=1 Tax=Phrynosoma platyrhinos TaxID=52577 RepID=A0ABQ7TAB3_PHRPL|nr:hypothetical protein JD844_001782 [Phrynosoma platyrhinos]
MLARTDRMQDDENEGAKLRAGSSSQRDPGETDSNKRERLRSGSDGKFSSHLQLSRRQYMKRIIAEYEALDMEMPCIRKFPRPPAARPLCLCLESPPEKEMNHAEVLAAVEAVIPDAFETGLLRNIQFENINLLCSGLTLGQEHFVLRRWDDLVMEDYRMHLRRALARQRLLDTLSDSWDGNHLDGM